MSGPWLLGLQKTTHCLHLGDQLWTIALHGEEDIVSVLGQKQGYTVKYIPEPKEGSGTFLTVYPDLSPNTNIIPFLKKDFWVSGAAASVLHKLY